MKKLVDLHVDLPETTPETIEISTAEDELIALRESQNSVLEGGQVLTMDELYREFWSALKAHRHVQFKCSQVESKSHAPFCNIEALPKGIGNLVMALGDINLRISKLEDHFTEVLSHKFMSSAKSAESYVIQSVNVKSHEKESRLSVIHELTEKQAIEQYGAKAAKAVQRFQDLQQEFVGLRAQLIDLQVHLSSERTSFTIEELSSDIEHLLNASRHFLELPPPPIPIVDNFAKKMKIRMQKHELFKQRMEIINTSFEPLDLASKIHTLQIVDKELDNSLYDIVMSEKDMSGVAEKRKGAEQTISAVQTSLEAMKTLLPSVEHEMFLIHYNRKLIRDSIEKELPQKTVDTDASILQIEKSLLKARKDILQEHASSVHTLQVSQRSLLQELQTMSKNSPKSVSSSIAACIRSLSFVSTEKRKILDNKYVILHCKFLQDILNTIHRKK